MSKEVLLTIGNLKFVNKTDFKELNEKYGHLFKRPLFKLIQSAIFYHFVGSDLDDISPKLNRLVVTIKTQEGIRGWQLSFLFYRDDTQIYARHLYRWKKANFFKKSKRFTFIRVR